MLTSKSLFHANVAFLFLDGRFAAPDNSEIAALFSGQAAQGARFVDDPVMRTKILTLPAAQMKVVLEGRRLRVEDEAGTEPDTSRLIGEAHRVCHTLFPQAPLEGFGFNFDLYCRFNNVLSIKNMFEYFFGTKILKTPDLRDFGFQFTLDRGGNPRTQRAEQSSYDGNNADIYFLKVTAPLEIAVHVNRHFAQRALPAKEQLQKLFENCYTDIDAVLSHLKA
ncbi:hypothetical protein HY250_01065 [Candidatus Azambacteria bacterium]|nr:hypothetical protein [Candidatus Azambacteria bacterium]